MIRIFAVIIAVVVSLAPLAAEAQQRDMETMRLCLCKNIMARMFCKDPADFNYVAKVRENLYLFSVFYANKPAKFYCGTGKDYVRIQGLDIVKTTHTIPYFYDTPSGCGVVSYANQECPKNEQAVCCAPKTVEDKKADDFWDRSIPELLDEDLKKALGDNATQNGTIP